MKDRPPWYLAVGDQLDRARCTLLLETFHPEILRVGRALRAKVETEHPGAAIRTKLLCPREIVERLGGYVREPEWDGIGVAYLHAATEAYGPASMRGCRWGGRRARCRFGSRATCGGSTRRAARR